VERVSVAEALVRRRPGVDDGHCVGGGIGRAAVYCLNTSWRLVASGMLVPHPPCPLNTGKAACLERDQENCGAARRQRPGRRVAGEGGGAMIRRVQEEWRPRVGVLTRTL